MQSIDDALEAAGFDDRNIEQLRSAFGTNDERLREVAEAAPELQRRGFDRDDITELLDRGYALGGLQRMSSRSRAVHQIGAFAVEHDDVLSLRGFTPEERVQLIASSNPRETIPSVTDGYNGLRAAGLSNANIAQLVHAGATEEFIDEVAVAGPEIARGNIPPTDLLVHANDPNARDWLHSRQPEPPAVEAIHRFDLIRQELGTTEELINASNYVQESASIYSGNVAQGGALSTATGLLDHALERAGVRRPDVLSWLSSLRSGSPRTQTQRREMNRTRIDLSGAI